MGAAVRRILALTLCAAGTLPAGNGKLSKDLTGIDPLKRIDVIVQFTSAPTDKQHAKVAAKGGQLKADLSYIKGAAYSIPAGQLKDLGEDPDVIYISPDRPVQSYLEFANPAVNANIARGFGYDGSGVGVAIIDSGLQGSPDLNSGGPLQKKSQTSRVVYATSVIAGLKPDDEYGHGTHIAGIIAGNGELSNTPKAIHSFIGIAPNANVISFRVLDANGAGTDSAVIAGIAQAVALKATYNIRIINLSLGRAVYESYQSDPLCQAVEYAWKNGVVVVVAAGNSGRELSWGTDGYGTITSPGNDPYVITVGAMKDMGTTSRSDDLIASYSSKGPTQIDHVVKPDVVAPGNHIVSLTRTSSSLYSKSDLNTNMVPYSYYIQGASASASTHYYRLSGTSMAAAMVSGAAALLIQKDPSATPDTVKARLMKTSTKAFPAFSSVTDPQTGITYTSQYDIFTVGAGYVDVWAALRSTDTVPSNMTALSPTATYDAATGNVYIGNTGSTPMIWGSHAVWGSSAVWGSYAFLNPSNATWGSSALWGSSAVWGSRNLAGFTAVWGSASPTASGTATSLSTSLNGEN